MRSTRILMTLGAAVALASPAAAQGRGRNANAGRVPPGQMPPSGMCRVWIDGVPPGRQPAPTDCATALATRPANARVIYGDDSRAGKGGKYNKRDRDEDRNDDRDVYGRDQQQRNGGGSNVWGIDPRTGRPTMSAQARRAILDQQRAAQSQGRGKQERERRPDNRRDHDDD